MGTADVYTLKIDGIDAPLRVTRVEGVERIHAPWSFDVTISTIDADHERVHVDLAQVVAQPATLGWKLHDGGDRKVEGVVEEADAFDEGYRVRLVPKLALLAQAVDHQVFVDEDTVEIATKVLSEHGVQVDARVRRSLPPRPQCAQAFESDLAFVARILAEDGIAYYLPLDKKDVVVLTDDPSGFDDVPGIGALPARDVGGLVHDESVHRARVRSHVVPDKVSFRDYDFEKPLLDQTVSADAGTSARERYEYPGFYADPAVGKDLAKIRLEQLRARRVVLTGETASRRLSPGYVLSVTDAGRARVGGRWLIVDVRHEAADVGAAAEERYLARFEAVPAESGYRPARPAAPSLGGIQTATVTGPSGTEIHTEQHGRVKVQHRWDRRRPRDDTSSSWVRVVQPPTSGGFFLPRVGWEALVAFHQKSADVPLVVGRLYNGQAVPPGALPGKKVVSAFGTLTTPGGGSANVISTDDSAGNEKMSFNASKDWNERTENDKNTGVTANDTWTVGANRTVIVGQVLTQAVDGAQTYSVGGSRTVNVTSNKMVNAASETVLIGGLRTFNVGGDLTTICSVLTRLVGAAKTELGIEHCNRAVQGAMTTLVGGSWSEATGVGYAQNVSGASTELVGGAKSVKALSYTLTVRGAYNETLGARTIKAGGERQESFAAAGSYTIGASASIKGSNVVVKATGKITLKAGGVTVTITPGSVTVDGDFKGSVACVDNGEVDYG
jgi:type VI secretion system secreted protein VgrG